MEMSRADYVAAKIHEAAGHPNAPRIFAIGADCPSAQNSADTAKEKGMTVKEEQCAKWVGVLKRDSEKLFGLSFHDALREILKNEEDEMEVKRGFGFYQDKANLLIGMLAKNLIISEAPYRVVGKGNSYIESDCYNFENVGEEAKWRLVEWSRFFFYDDKIKSNIYNLYWSPGIIVGEESIRRVQWECVWIVGNIISEQRINKIVRAEGFCNIDVHVCDARAMNACKKFARVWEAKSKQLKGSREATVTLYQDYAD